MKSRFKILKKRLIELVVVEDAFGFRLEQQNGRSLFGGIDGSLVTTPINGSQSFQKNTTTRQSDKSSSPPILSGGKSIGGDQTTNSVHKKEQNYALEVVTNTRWGGNSNQEKVNLFQDWLRLQIGELITDISKEERDRWWKKYIQRGYEKGTGRAFTDVRKPFLQGALEQPGFFEGSKKEFLLQSFAHTASIEKVDLLAGRVFTDLQGITDAMSLEITRALTDGMIEGSSPLEVARKMTKTIDKVDRTRARTMARTETIRAHAEGQLDAMERLGVDKIGVAVEWSTTGDDRVCELCGPMSGVVLTPKEARGLIPRHPNCRCAFIPANVGEDKPSQKRSPTAIRKAIKKSVRAGTPKKRRSPAAPTVWAGQKKRISRKRPKSILD